MLEENPADEMTNVDKGREVLSDKGKGAEEFILFLLCICLYLLFVVFVSCNL